MTAHQPVLECPKCKKNGLVRLHSESDIFECVYCHYKDDLTTTEGGNFMGILLTAFCAIAITLLALGV